MASNASAVTGTRIPWEEGSRQIRHSSRPSFRSNRSGVWLPQTWQPKSSGGRKKGQGGQNAILTAIQRARAALGRTAGLILLQRGQSFQGETRLWNSRRESLFIEIHGGKSPKPIFRRGSCALCPEASCEAAGETHEILPGRQRPWEKERKS